MGRGAGGREERRNRGRVTMEVKRRKGATKKGEKGTVEAGGIG